ARRGPRGRSRRRPRRSPRAPFRAPPRPRRRAETPLRTTARPAWASNMFPRNPHRPRGSPPPTRVARGGEGLGVGGGRQTARHCEERSDEAIQECARCLDCFVAAVRLLAMTRRPMPENPNPAFDLAQASICAKRRARPPTPDPSPPFAARMGGGEPRGLCTFSPLASLAPRNDRNPPPGSTLPHFS